MEKIIFKIYCKSRDQLLDDILKTYNEEKFAIINFIYFANLKRFLLNKKNFHKKYYKSLKDAHFLLPDGIALKIYLKIKFKISIENLNWTDFSPYFLEKTSNLKRHIAFYTVYDEKIWKKKSDFKKVEGHIKENFKPHSLIWFLSHYSKRWKDFDFNLYQKSLDWDNFDLKILLVWLWTPFQELWIQENIEFFQKNNILIMNVGWLFDFWSWFEKRAPKFVRNLNMERARRFIQSPKKNLWKVLDSFKLLLELAKK